MTFELYFQARMTEKAYHQVIHQNCSHCISAFWYNKISSLPQYKWVAEIFFTLPNTVKGKHLFSQEENMEVCRLLIAEKEMLKGKVEL